MGLAPIDRAFVLPRTKWRTQNEEGHMANKKQTSRRIATLAARTLANPHAGKKVKELAASALSQAEGKRRKSR